MGTFSYDVNVQLALATTAEFEGDFETARAFLAEAARVAREDRDAQARVRYALDASLASAAAT